MRPGLRVPIRDRWLAYAKALVDGAHGLLHIKLVTSKREYIYGSYHIQNVNAYISRLKRWMRRFNGVATRHLDNYLGWWRMIDRMGDSLTPLTCIAAALPQAST